MTDSIDLDDLGIEEEGSDDERPNRGDWFWQGEGDPEDEISRTTGDSAATEHSSDAANATDDAANATDDAANATDDAANATDDADGAGDADEDAVGAAEDADGEPDAEKDADAEKDTDTAASSAPSPAEAAEAAADGPTPRVPRADDDRPVGIPKTSGGSGGTAAKNQPEDRTEMSEAERAAAGPHGGGVDDMTTAFTLRALRRLENLHAALTDANEWSDWIGIVGDVDAHVINKFQRDNQVDADFFNGSGTGPGERLAEIDSHSMFYAERMVVLGCEDEAWIAEAADWEFVAIETAAEKSGWAFAEE